MGQSTFSWAELPASPSPSPDSERDSLIRAATSRSPFWRWLTELTRDGSSGRTSPASYPQLPTTLPIRVRRKVEWRPILDPTTGTQKTDASGRPLWSRTSTTQTKSMRSPVSWPDFKNSGTGSPTLLSTLSSSVWRSGASVCSLSRILESGPHLLRYCLSLRACAGILRRAEKRGKSLPAPLLLALRQAADSGRTSTAREDSRSPEPSSLPPRTGGGSYRGDAETETFVIAHALRAEGADASEDGTGRGTPLTIYPLQEVGMRESKDQNGVGMGVASPNEPMYTLQAGAQHGVAVTAPCLRSNAYNNSDPAMEAQMIVPFDTTQMTSAANRSQPKPGDPCHPLAAGAHPPAVAFQESQSGAREYAEAGCLRANGPGHDPVGTRVRDGSTVRRLTPTECERLQGFPDGWTAITYRGKPAADGPRYRALGNSIAVPCLAWIGRRLEIVDAAQRR